MKKIDEILERYLLEDTSVEALEKRLKSLQARKSDADERMEDATHGSSGWQKAKKVSDSYKQKMYKLKDEIRKAKSKGKATKSDIESAKWKMEQ